MDAGALREQLARDRRPFLVVATAGTTNTGAVDPLEEVADAAAEAGAWLHVDGAYGGFFALTERGRARLAGIERADSVALDPHKGMFIPYAAGILLVRDFANLSAAHSVEAEYMQDLHGDHGAPNFSAASPELSRDFRGLRVWLPLQLHGLGAFRAALDEKLDLTERLHAGLAADERLEIVPGPPQLSVVGWRLRDGDDGAQRAFQDRINASRRIHLSSTVISGRFTLRACILSHRTHADRVDDAITLIRNCA
jgi:aromatic-L-amino-acid/L-tryptophan decarboxylase